MRAPRRSLQSRCAGRQMLPRHSLQQQREMRQEQLEIFLKIRLSGDKARRLWELLHHCSVLRFPEKGRTQVVLCFRLFSGKLW